MMWAKFRRLISTVAVYVLPIKAIDISGRFISLHLQWWLFFLIVPQFFIIGTLLYVAELSINYYFLSVTPRGEAVNTAIQNLFIGVVTKLLLASLGAGIFLPSIWIMMTLAAGGLILRHIKSLGEYQADLIKLLGCVPSHFYYTVGLPLAVSLAVPGFVGTVLQVAVASVLLAYQSLRLINDWKFIEQGVLSIPYNIFTEEKLTWSKNFISAHSPPRAVQWAYRLVAGGIFLGVGQMLLTLLPVFMTVSGSLLGAGVVIYGLTFYAMCQWLYLHTSEALNTFEEDLLNQGEAPARARLAKFFLAECSHKADTKSLNSVGEALNTQNIAEGIVEYYRKVGTSFSIDSNEWKVWGILLQNTQIHSNPKVKNYLNFLIKNTSPTLPDNISSDTVVSYIRILWSASGNDINDIEIAKQVYKALHKLFTLPLPTQNDVFRGLSALPDTSNPHLKVYGNYLRSLGRGAPWGDAAMGAADPRNAHTHRGKAAASVLKKRQIYKKPTLQQSKEALEALRALLNGISETEQPFSKNKIGPDFKEVFYGKTKLGWAKWWLEKVDADYAKSINPLEDFGPIVNPDTDRTNFFDFNFDPYYKKYGATDVTGGEIIWQLYNIFLKDFEHWVERNREKSLTEQQSSYQLNAAYTLTSLLYRLARLNNIESGAGRDDGRKTQQSCHEGKGNMASVDGAANAFNTQFNGAVISLEDVKNEASGYTKSYFKAQLAQRVPSELAYIISNWLSGTLSEVHFDVVQGILQQAYPTISGNYLDPEKGEAAYLFGKHLLALLCDPPIPEEALIWLIQRWRAYPAAGLSEAEKKDCVLASILQEMGSVLDPTNRKQHAERLWQAAAQNPLPEISLKPPVGVEKSQAILAPTAVATASLVAYTLEQLRQSMNDVVLAQWQRWTESETPLVATFHSKLFGQVDRVLNSVKVSAINLNALMIEAHRLRKDPQFRMNMRQQLAGFPGTILQQIPKAAGQAVWNVDEPLSRTSLSVEPPASAPISDARFRIA